MMAADLEIFKRLYLFSLTSYGLITGLADFPFTERCYWCLQSTLNPCRQVKVVQYWDVLYHDIFGCQYCNITRY